MTLFLLAALVLSVVTSVHEAGHWIAIRWKEAVVDRVTVGRGPRLWTSASGAFELRLLPLGGRIEWRGLRPGTGRAVVAVGGPTANLVFAWICLFLAFLAPGVEVPPFGAGEGGAASRAARDVAGWVWIVPGALEEILRTGSATELNRGLRSLVEILRAGKGSALPYVGGATSAIWAALNLIPIPLIRTDGWVILRALWDGLRARVVRSGTHPNTRR